MTTDGNFVKDECWDTLQYGRSFNYKKKYKVYQSEQIPGFVCLYDTDTDTKEIYRYKNNRLQDGAYREIFSSGDSSYGTMIFAKSDKTGEEKWKHRLFKYASGKIYYQEKIIVLGQGKGWRLTTRYNFNPNNLKWEKTK